MSATEFNYINEKKQETGQSSYSSSSSSSSSTKKSADYKDFLKTFLINDVIGKILILVFVVGSVFLYMTKVAFSDMLNTAADTDIVDVEMHTMKERPWWGFDFISNPIHTWEQHATFSKRIKYPFEVLFKQSAKEKNSNAPVSNVRNYLLETMKYNSEINNSTVNRVFGSFYLLPEWITMCLAPLVFMLLFCIFFVINFVFHFVGYVKYFKLLFASTEQNPNTLLDLAGLGAFALFQGWLLFWFWPVITTFYAFILPVLQTYSLTKKEDGVKTSTAPMVQSTFIQFLKDSFVSKQVLFFILATLSMLSNANKYLGPEYMIGGIMAAILIAAKGGYNNHGPPNASFAEAISK